MILRWPAYSALLLTLILLCGWEVAGKKDPKITSKQFDNAAFDAFYFDDSEVIIWQDREKNDIWRSADGGETWALVEDEGQKGKIWSVRPHPFDKKKAYLLSLEHKHWVTSDRGETWTKFETEANPALFEPTLRFHGRDSNKALFEGGICHNWECEQEIMYTKNNFKDAKKLRDNAVTCAFARARPEFETSEDDNGDDRIICIVAGRNSFSRSDFRIVVSDDYFKTEYEPTLEGDRTVKGMMDIAQQSKYFLAAARAEGTDELALYVTDDAKQWHRAEFSDHKLVEGAYTVLESTNYSLQVDVMTTKLSSAMGVLFTSNSNGTYFTRNVQHTNRDENFRVDFEKVSGIQGIVIVNTVENWAEVEETDFTRKNVQSKISFDDGRTFQPLKVGKKELHLHSITDAGFRPRVFSSPAPGVVMGVGNTGSKLKAYGDGDLWVSNDAGLTWDHALDGPHRYEFGDQGSVLVAVSDDGPTNEIQYSIDHGKTWTPVDVGMKFTVRRLMTTPDSTGLKFVLFAFVEGKEKKRENWVFSFDFDKLHERECKDKDFEDWPARLNEKGDPDCLMGHKQFYRRRKADSDCFIGKEFKDPVPTFEPCTCTAEDFECDFNYVRSEDGKDCIPSSALTGPEGVCEGEKGTYKGSSGWRLIPGDDCKRGKGEQLDKEVERPCKEVAKPPASGKVKSEKIHFDSKDFAFYTYMERKETSGGDDETVVMQTVDGKVWLSKDHAQTWQQILKGETITGVHPHSYFSDYIYFTTDTKKVFYSIHRGDNIRSFEAPEGPNVEGTFVLQFHQDYPDWLIWTGARECSDPKSTSCHSVASVTTDRGDNWSTLLRYVRKCQFIQREGRGTDKKYEKLVYCEQRQNEDPNQPLQLVSSENWFGESKTHFANLVDFATRSEFIVVATRTTEETLKVDASVDGQTFADAEFPHGFVVEHQHAYTVLKSDTHAVFLHVTVNGKDNQEYGAIIKSNSNGTSYVMVHRAVNRNRSGYVDFEKVEGIEGVDVINVVSNVKEAEKGKGKKLRTMITHNDGAKYLLLAPPEKDAEGKDWGCSVTKGKGTDKCALHLHGYTERLNLHNTYSSPSAIGLLTALGNVGDHLLSKEESDTFMSDDGGVTWKAIKKGQYLWEYGDQGSIIILVEQSKPTKIAYYSRDEGSTWQEYPFSDIDMQINDVTTLQSDTSRQFILWGKETGDGAKSGVFSVNIDFSGLTDRPCNLDEGNSNGDESDYYLWEPKHPLSDDNCLFGHVAQYKRKKKDRDCYNGRKFEQFVVKTRDCECSRMDYECDYNYEPTDIGDCALVKGFQPPDHSLSCKENPDQETYFLPTGFRRIPITTCKGGKEFDKQAVERPCPGYGDKFARKHRISGTGLFFAIVIPLVAAAAVGYWVYYNWDGKFGQIRLGDSGPNINRDSPWISYPIAAVAGIVAVAGAIPLLAMSLWRSARGYMPVGGGGGTRTYVSRQSFARGRGEYAGAVEDEDELLGEDDDEGEEV